MLSSKARRKVAPSNGDADNSADKQDQLLLSSAVCNGEDLGPFVRKAFASGKPETLLHNLRHFARSKESEIEEVCKAHYQDFILAVDDLRSLLSDVDSLKSALSDSNSKLQSVARPLLTSLDSYLEAQTGSNNVNLALSLIFSCIKLLELCSRCNFHLSGGNFYMALKCVDSIETDFLDKTPSSTLKRMLEKKIPEIRSHIERKVSKEFGDWLVEIRVDCRNLGQLAIGQASAARQREEDLRIKQRQAEEQSRLSLRDCVYALQEEEEDDGLSGVIGDDGNSNGGGSGFDLTPLYRAYHIHQTLGLEDRFKQYYFENRKLQLTSDFQVSSMTPFLESHQTFFAQIAGFFIVEDQILRTGGRLISRMEVENLWETAVSKMCSVLEDQFSRMQTANHLLLIKDYVSLLGVTLRRYGYPVDSLLDVLVSPPLSRSKSKFHNCLFSEKEMASTSSPGEEPQNQNQDQQQQQQEVVVAVKEREKECLHKTKTIHFLGRTTPIVLQNDNGPCPLLAICNVLLLKNNLNLSSDSAEVSQEKLLSLVAERLIDSNSNVNNKDAGYVENQQQNIADAIDLLPRLATGIDVNLKFRRIDDFEFTRECAIFDLLDLPLYHGWIVDPQDYDTANAIGPKSYNTLMGELVALETRNMEDEGKNLIGEDSKTKTEEDCIDFVAATTATLGVPSPCLSKATSFDDSPHSVSDHQKVRKGDLEEEEELLRVLKLSETELPISMDDSLVANVDGRVVSVGSHESTPMKGTMVVASWDTSEGHVGVDINLSALSIDDNNNPTSSETPPGKLTGSSLKTDLTDHFDKSVCTESGEHFSCNDVIENTSADTVVEIQGALSLSCARSTGSFDRDPTDILHDGQKVENQSTSITEVHKPADISSGHDMLDLPGLASLVPESDSSSGRIQNFDTPDTFTSSVDGSEPIYEGEECILDSRTSNCEDREPMYEGEVILSEQADKTVRSKDEITSQQGELIRNFLKNNASQLTFKGLFCLQDGLKERELCVFFRNNHFSTMFKYDGELYLLATDQGYINQPDLVWEKLNEVNGDTLFMTGNFKEFKAESHTNDPWDEHNAMTSTADYLASIGSAAQAGVDINSDLQLAIALQQQEYEQQQQPQRHNVQQASTTGGSRLITGPQVPRSSGRTASSSSSPPRLDTKSKDKCNVM